MCDNPKSYIICIRDTNFSNSMCRNSHPMSLVKENVNPPCMCRDLGLQ